MLGAARVWLRSLRGRFLSAVALLLLTFAGTTAALAAQRESAGLLAELQRTARGTTQLMAPTTTNWVLRGNISDLQQGLRAVRAQHGVVDAYVLDPTGMVVADGTSGRSVQRHLGGAREAAALAATEPVVMRRGSTLDAVWPLDLSGERLGTLVVGFSMTEVEEAARTSRDRHLLTGLLFALAGLVLTWLLVRGVTRRLLELTATAQDAAQVQLPALVAGLRAGSDVTALAPEPLPVRSTDEVGHLAAALNTYREVVMDMAVELTGLLRSSDARFSRAFNASPIGMALTTPDGTLQEVNASLCRMLGRSAPDLVGTSLEALRGDEDGVGTPLGPLHAGSDVAQAERRYLRSDGTTVWTLHTAIVERDAHEVAQYVFVQLVDTTERKRSEAELARRAFHDELTGLPNRAEVLRVLERSLGQAELGTRVALLMLDLDRFKLVNDSLGHAAGDELLQQVAARLTSAVGPGGTVGRLGGDEFVVCAAPYDVAGAEALGRRILAALTQPTVVAGRSVHPTASVGVALGDSTCRAADLLRDADTAAYAAKTAGRGTVVVFDDQLRRRAQTRLRTEEDIRRGLDAAQFLCLYQPLVEATTRHVVGLEALVRWQHDGRLRTPDDFLDVAEDSGLVVPLGRAVLRAACEQLQAWRAASPGRRLQMSVNVSPQQLRRDDLPAVVAEVLAETGLPADALYLEITEATLMEEEAVPVVRRLRDQGVRIALDDFGTGYSSLGYLRRIPVDLVKVDRSFAVDLDQDPQAMAVMAAVIELAHAMHLPVLAEGVERPAQAEILARLGCDLLQGYALARPLTAEAAGVLLAAGPLTTPAGVPLPRPPGAGHPVLGRVETLGGGSGSATRS